MPATLFLLPGLLCDARVWQHQFASLTDLADMRIPDFREMSSLEAMAQAVLEQAPERFYLAGHSMGGRVALQILHMAPERIIRLALLDTGLHPPAAGEKAKRQVLTDLATTQGMAALARTWAPPMVHPERLQDLPLMNDIFAMVERYTPDNFRNQINALVTRPDAGPFLARAPAHTLVLCGRQDTWSPPQQHEDIARAIPDHPAVVIIENSGHMSPMEQPEAVTLAMRQWLERI